MKYAKLHNTTFIFETEEDAKSFWEELLHSENTEVIHNTFIVRKRSWFTKLLFSLLRL